MKIILYTSNLSLIFFLVALFRQFNDLCCTLPRVVGHFVEETLLLVEFVWMPDFSHQPLVHHDHLVVVGDCEESVRDRNQSFMLELFPQNLLDEPVCLLVNV